MNAVETLEIIKALHAAGASHFKSQDFEITIAAGKPIVIEAPKPPEPAVEDSTKKIKEMIDTLKMDDSQLLDKIFPAGAGG